LLRLAGWVLGRRPRGRSSPATRDARFLLRAFPLIACSPSLLDRTLALVPGELTLGAPGRAPLTAAAPATR